jgi:hypothetical protein
MADHSNSTAEVNLVAIDIAKQWNVVLVKESSDPSAASRWPTHPRITSNWSDSYRLFPARFGLRSSRPEIITGRSRSGYIAGRLRGGFHLLGCSGSLSRSTSRHLGQERSQRRARDSGHARARTRADLLRSARQGTHDLQELSNTYYQVTLARTRLQHSLLTHHLPLYFPEFARYWYSTRSEWFIRFLIRFPIPSAISELPRDRFVGEAWDLVGRKCAKQAKLEEIYELASASIGLPVAIDSPAIEAFRLQLQRYEELNERRKWLDARAQELLADNADFNRLIRMPGIAAITALTILAEAGDLRRFGHHRQFLKYCGLDLVKSQSGQAGQPKDHSQAFIAAFGKSFFTTGLP